jgi:acetolactate synthase I/II/III large subunit
MTETMTTAEATVASLAAHGIETLYALPGVHNDHLFDALYKASDRIKVVHPRHEQGTAYMALGAALATARPQAYAVVPGPGLLNTGAALLTAYAMNAPVLGLIGQIPAADIGRGLGQLHEIRDQAGIISRLVDFSARISGPQDASALVAKAVARWHRGGAARPCSNAPSMSGAAPARRRSRRPCRWRSPTSTRTRSPPPPRRWAQPGVP